MQHHKYSLNEIDSMMPWEREIYLSMLSAYLAEKEKHLEDLENG